MLGFGKEEETGGEAVPPFRWKWGGNFVNMLNKTDLSRIGKVVKEELGNYVTKTNLAQALQNHPTKSDLARELKPVKQDVAKIRKDIDVIISLFDREYIDLRKRVDRIEQHLGIVTS